MIQLIQKDQLPALKKLIVEVVFMIPHGDAGQHIAQVGTLRETEVQVLVLGL